MECLVQRILNKLFTEVVNPHTRKSLLDSVVSKNGYSERVFHRNTIPSYPPEDETRSLICQILHY